MFANFYGTTTVINVQKVCFYVYEVSLNDKILEILKNMSHLLFINYNDQICQNENSISEVWETYCVLGLLF